MMEVPRDFQLLDDDYEDTQSLKQTNNSINKGHVLGLEATKSSANQSRRFNISPNRPNANQQTKLELKSIERRRVSSPLKLKGIQDYVESYSTGPSTTNTSNNKITMNLKMDDLLASVKNESSAYQTLADFSIMTGETDHSIFAPNSMVSPFYCCLLLVK